MFETSGWVREDPIVGPVPLSPLPEWTTSELLAWADRAPFTGSWVDALRLAANPGPTGEMLPYDQRLRLIRAWDRLRQGVEAEFLGAVGLLSPQTCPSNGPACPGGSRCLHDWSREDVSVALHLAPQTVSTLLMDARELAGRAAPLLAAVSAGRLPGYGARRIAHRLAAIDDDSTFALVLGRVLAKVGTTTPGMLDRLASVTIEGLRDPAEALAAHQRADHRDTGIVPGMPLEDGMGSATITASAVDIAELLAWARTFTTANRGEDDTRTVGQRRVDALLDALTAPKTTVTGAEPSADLSPATHARPAAAPMPTSSAARHRTISLRLFMTADSLIGATNDPGWLQGTGAIPAYLARELAVAPSALTGALTDTRGALLNLGRTHRFALTDLDRFVKARDLTCTWPGCNRSSEDCELDHITPWGEGGSTDQENLHPLCPRHHRARDVGWTPSRNSDGTTSWTSPTGLRYLTLPADPPQQRWPEQRKPPDQQRQPERPPGQPTPPSWPPDFDPLARGEDPTMGQPPPPIDPPF